MIDTPEPPEVVGLCDLTITCPGLIPDAPRIGCNLVVADAAGTVSWDGRAGMQLRGRSSAGFPKPQLSVELWDAADQEQSASLLGMGAEADWVINGAYIDRALLRNQLAFDLFQALGGPERYAPESHTCRATFNGRPAGVFFLTETIKRDDDRVDVPDDPNGEAFVVKLDDEPGLLDNSPVGYGIWQAVSPRLPTPQQSAGILASLGGWQGALLGPRPADPVDGIFAFVDPDSAVDFVLLQELMQALPQVLLCRLEALPQPLSFVHIIQPGGCERRRTNLQLFAIANDGGRSALRETNSAHSSRPVHGRHRGSWWGCLPRPSQALAKGVPSALLRHDTCIWSVN